MTEEDKKLLLADLCSRLPYGIIVRCDKYKNLPDVPCFEYKGEGMFKLYADELPIEVEFIKPYLRPMSSMTEEEKEELKSKCIHTETEEDWEGVRCDVWGIQILDKYDTRRWDNPIWPSTINIDAIDWLNTRHFDYRGLIEKGLALEAPDGMYDIKEK